MTDDQIIARARRRLLTPGDHTEWDYEITARDAVALIVAGLAEQNDAELAIFTGLDMPAWNEPSGMWPTLGDPGPLLGLLEVAT